MPQIPFLTAPLKQGKLQNHPRTISQFHSLFKKFKFSFATTLYVLKNQPERRRISAVGKTLTYSFENFAKVSIRTKTIFYVNFMGFLSKF